MTQKQLYNWVNKFMKGWENQNPTEVMLLFDRIKLSYFESAVKPPITSWEKVNKLWQVVPNNQRNVKLTWKIVAFNNEFGIINWQLKRFFIPANKDQLVDGIFIVTLNSDGLCTYFNQWRSVA